MKLAQTLISTIFVSDQWYLQLSSCAMPTLNTVVMIFIWLIAFKSRNKRRPRTDIVSPAKTCNYLQTSLSKSRSIPRAASLGDITTTGYLQPIQAYRSNKDIEKQFLLLHQAMIHHYSAKIKTKIANVTSLKSMCMRATMLEQPLSKIGSGNHSVYPACRLVPWPSLACWVS